MAVALVFAVLLARLSAASDPLLQEHRPPQQTPTQANLMANLSQWAAKQSSNAKSWVLNYMGNETLRSRLDASMQNLSNIELLERFTWEFSRLPIFHNTPVDASDASQIYMHDDTIVATTLANGYMQNACHRFVFGGNQPRNMVEEYATFFTEMGMPLYSSEWTVRQANECLLFNANNLQKVTQGDTVLYGGMTYVLNPRALEGRLLVEVWDAADMQQMFSKTHLRFPGYGTPDHWYHLVQAHEAVFNLPYPEYMPSSQRCCNYSVADLLNRWWVPSAPVPTTGMLVLTPYYEIMTVGNVWLPEDLLYSIAKFSNERSFMPPHTWGTRYVGAWGTPAGHWLRNFSVVSKRPLVWADVPDGPMLIDPVVGVIEGAHITTADIALFSAAWQDISYESPAQQSARFRSLAEATPPHLKLYFQSWLTRSACAKHEDDPSNMIMGVDGHGNCVFWRHDAVPSRYELLNDGTCAVSMSARATFATKDMCTAASRSATWACVESGQRHHCAIAKGPHKSLGECEATCRTNQEPCHHEVVI